MGAGGSGSSVCGKSFGDGFFIIVDDSFEGEVEPIETMFLDDIADIG